MLASLKRGTVRVGNNGGGGGGCGNRCSDGIAFVDRQVPGQVRAPGEGDVQGSAIAASGQRGRRCRERATSQAKCLDGGANICARGRRGTCWTALQFLSQSPSGTAASTPDGSVLRMPEPCTAKATTGKLLAHVAAATLGNLTACVGSAIKITITLQRTGAFDGGGIGQQCTNQIKRSRVGGTR